jgi:hypothetical protein
MEKKIESKKHNFNKKLNYKINRFITRNAYWHIEHQYAHLCSHLGGLES